MKKYFLNNRNTHFFAGGAVAAFALIALKKKKLRHSILALAGLEIINGLSTSAKKEGNIPFTQIREKSMAIPVNGIRMRWEEYGEASADNIPVIMVHGLPTNPRVWRYVIPQLTKNGIHCLAWEQVGFGKSLREGLEHDISIPRQAEYLYSWLEKMGIEKAVFVGHDYGGGVVQQILVNHPEKVQGIVLADVVAYDNWPVISVRTARSVNAAIEHLPPSLIKPFLLAGITNLGHENLAIKEESVQLFCEPYETTVGAKAFAHQLRHFNSDDTEKIGRRIEEKDFYIPARVIWGENDPLGVASGERLAKALNASFIKIPGGKHFTIEDHPHEVAKAILDVFSEVENKNDFKEEKSGKNFPG